MLASIIDGKALVQVIWVSVAAGVGLTFVFSLTIAAAARASHLKRVGNGGAALGWTAVAVLCTAVCAIAVVLGVIVMLNK